MASLGVGGDGGCVEMSTSSSWAIIVLVLGRDLILLHGDVSLSYNFRLVLGCSKEMGDVVTEGRAKLKICVSIPSTNMISAQRMKTRYWLRPIGCESMTSDIRAVV